MDNGFTVKVRTVTAGNVYRATIGWNGQILFRYRLFLQADGAVGISNHLDGYKGETPLSHFVGWRLSVESVRAFMLEVAARL